MKKFNTFWDTKNTIIGFKSLLIGIITGIIMIIPFWLSKWIITSKLLLVAGAAFLIVLIFLYFHIWGYLANRFWRWE